MCLLTLNGQEKKFMPESRLKGPEPVKGSFMFGQERGQLLAI